MHAMTHDAYHSQFMIYRAKFSFDTVAPKSP